MIEFDVGSATADAFAPHLNDVFTVKAPGGAMALTLAQVRRLGQALRDGGAFSLLFVAPREPVLPQAIYPVSHSGLGQLEIFLVPIGPVEGGLGYEAVFT